MCVITSSAGRHHFSWTHRSLRILEGFDGRITVSIERDPAIHLAGGGNHGYQQAHTPLLGEELSGLSQSQKKYGQSAQLQHGRGAEDSSDQEIAEDRRLHHCWRKEKAGFGLGDN